MSTVGARTGMARVFVDGRIVESGGPELADKLEESGYEQWGVSTNGHVAPEASGGDDGTD
ncbi:MAG: hypothetical protein ACRDV4_10760 [Acidimicrobiales bacterium]